MSHGHVKFAGLIYPIEAEKDKNTTQAPIFNLSEQCQFIIDGPNVSSDSINKEHFFETLKSID